MGKLSRTESNRW